VAHFEPEYIDNTNLLYLSQNEVNVGTLRETFFMNQLRIKSNVTLAEKGDFIIDDKYTFEVGGSSKSFKQIAGIENSFLVLDDLPIGINNKIPLWLFGFLY
jgi:hypothetical protein